MSDKPKLIRDTDEQARTQARDLISQARFGSLAVIDPETGFPFVSRVALAVDTDGVPVILISRLAKHRQAIEQDNRVSLMTGEPGKGDPLAHPRITTFCLAEIVERGSQQREELRALFLETRPKAALYIDFPDFDLFRLVPQSALMNGGFGKAYTLNAGDLKTPAQTHPSDNH